MVSGCQGGTNTRGASFRYALVGAARRPPGCCRVKILLDTNVPVQLAWALRGHEATSTIALHWESHTNGKLLEAAQTAGFDVIITCDQNIPLQQNFADRKLGLVVLSTNHWPTLRAAASNIAAKVDFVQRGQIVRIDVSDRTSPA